MEGNMEGKLTLFAVSSYKEKFYFSKETETLPEGIKNEIKQIGVYFVNKVGGIFTLGFYKDGEIFIDYSFLENDFAYDEIGAKLEIEQIKREKREFIEALALWYKVFKGK